MRIGKNGVVQAPQFNEGGTNYSIVGTPTISSDGILSGMAVNNNYLTANIDFTAMNTFRISCGFTANTTSTGRHKTVWHLWDGGAVNFFQFWLKNGSNTDYQLTYPSGAETDSTLDISSLATDTKHTVVFDYDGTTLRVYVDGTLKTSVAITKAYLQKEFFLTIGTCSRDNHAKYFAGTIDLRDYSIQVNGVTVFAPATDMCVISAYQTTSNTFYEV